MTWRRSPEDRTRSPFTGLTRAHWVEAAEHLLTGVLQHAPETTAWRLPRQDTAITYPQPGDPAWRLACESMEGITRTLLIAAPLLHHNPDLVLAGRRVADLYLDGIARLVRPGEPENPGTSAAVVALSGARPYQVSCDAASLVLGLTVARQALWERFAPADRANLVAFLQDWGHARVNPHNWRWFAVHVLSFLEREGYAIDRSLLDEHLRMLRTYDAGDGWIRDGSQFDYYSPWAMQFYGHLWTAWGGRDSHPEIARAVVKSAHRLFDTYDRSFARDGRMMMWGRSNIYRFCAVSPWASAALLPELEFDHGVGRRVMSGCLRQFLDHPDFLRDGLPTLGFLGPFPPLLQPYSCAASPYWFGNAFQALALPADHAFWTTPEREGSWAEVPPDGVRETHLRGPGLTFAQHGPTGATEWRTSKTIYGTTMALRRAYVRLALHTDLPWSMEPADGWPSMLYRLRLGPQAWIANALLAAGRRGDVLHRRLLFDFAPTPGHQLGECPVMDLADTALPYGLLRCDRFRCAEGDAELVLGHYALPLADGEEPVVMERSLPDGARAWTVTGQRGSLALVAIRGWTDFAYRVESGLHADAPAAALPALVSERRIREHGDPFRLSLLLYRNDDQPWAETDLWPFALVEELPGATGGDGPAFRFTFRDGRAPVEVDYTGLEGELSV